MCFRCYGNLKFPLTFNGKSENRRLLLSHSRYFDKSFTEMFFEYSSSKPLNLIGCHGNQKVKSEKKIFKNHLLRSHKGDEIKTLQKCS